MIVARAPAKVILTGEHFVVHGQYALAAAINLYSMVSVEPGPLGVIEINSTTLGINSIFPIRISDEKDTTNFENTPLEPLRLIIQKSLERAGKFQFGLRLQVKSEIPVGVGLGSSASTAVSTAAAVTRFLNIQLDKQEIFELASIQEKYVHKRPSGIDAATATYGGVILFKLGQPPEHLMPSDEISIIIGNTGKSRSTGVLVSKVSSRVDVGDRDLKKISYVAGQLTLQALRAYKNRDFNQLGRLMNRNQELLVQIGVSTPQLDNLIRVARDTGALGAKLTGAGGGGCMIAISKPEDSKKVARAIDAAGGYAYIVTIDRRGVEID